MQKKTLQIIGLVALGLVNMNIVHAQTKPKKDTVREIDEVVVTALGIKRQDKALGYVAQKVGASTFEETQNNNWAQSLEGKVAVLKSRQQVQGPLVLPELHSVEKNPWIWIITTLL